MNPRLFVLNEPTAPRLNPALACEIGLNESLILLQLEFWISISNNTRDGQQWTYQSTRDIRDKAFPFWSVMTINRTIKSLESKGLIHTTSKYNTAKYDKTRWFSMNYGGLSKLKTISMGGYGTGSSQNGTGSSQNGTTIPETTTEIKNDVPPDPQQPPPMTTPTAPSVVAPSIESKKTVQPPTPATETATMETALTALCAMIPEPMRKPSVIAKIAKAVESGIAIDMIRSCIAYSNDHSDKKTWQRYRSHLGQCLDGQWGAGYEGAGPEDAAAKEQDIIKARLELPPSALKAMADSGDNYAIKALEIIKRE